MSFFIREARVREISDVVVVALFRVKRMVRVRAARDDDYVLHHTRISEFFSFFLSSTTQNVQKLHLPNSSRVFNRNSLSLSFSLSACRLKKMGRLISKRYEDEGG